MRFPDTEICYECGEPFFDLEKMGDQWLCVLCRYHFENEGCPYESVTKVTDKELDKPNQVCYSIDSHRERKQK